MVYEAHRFGDEDHRKYHPYVAKIGQEKIVRTRGITIFGGFMISLRIFHAV
jgi:hypothetical protein